MNGYAVEYNADGTILKQGIWKDDEFQITQATPSTTDASSERKLALVIGNAEYLIGPLDNPVNDARLIGTTLKSLGFEVYIKRTLTKNDETRHQGFGGKLSQQVRTLSAFYFQAMDYKATVKITSAQ